MLYFVAPYDGSVPEKSMFFAATQKIRFLLQALVDMGNEVVLINTNPHYASYSELSFSSFLLSDDVEVGVASFPREKNAYYSYIRNLVQVGGLCDKVIARYGRPSIVWCYNGYALESAIGGYLKKKCASRYIIEFEDWHFSRNRGLNPKPIIDWLYWRNNFRYIDSGTAVNSFLLGKLQGVNSFLLPGVLGSMVGELASKFPPFRHKGDVNVGYFGGLSKDKGAPLLLNVIDYVVGHDLPVKFTVTGDGEYREQFESRMKTECNKLVYHGRVSDEELLKRMRDVDIIVNPHTENDGVFPFKIMEAIGSGRLVVSTQLPDVEIGPFAWMKDAIVICEEDPAVIAHRLADGHKLYARRKVSIERAAKKACELYSKEGVARMLSSLLA